MDCNKFDLCIDSIEKNNIKAMGCLSENCLSSYDSRNKVVVEENKKRYELVNDKHEKIACFHVDGGMIKSKVDMKCDNLLVSTSSKQAILVELKGSDLKHAFEQIDRTMRVLSSGLIKYCIYARIVTSSRTNVPNIRACPQYIALSRKITKEKGNIKIQSNNISECISNL